MFQERKHERASQKGWGRWGLRLSVNDAVFVALSKHCFVFRSQSFQVHAIVYEVACCELVVKLPCRVAVLRRPLQPNASLLPRLLRDRFDDLSPISLTSEFVINVEVW